MMTGTRPRWLAWWLLLLPAGIAGPAHASGFDLIEREAAGLGRAFAGQAAVRSPAAVSFNPAAVPESTQLALDLSQLWNQLDPEDAGTPATVPALFGTTQGIGLGLYGSFGLATDYPDDWDGRYHALHSGIEAARVQLAGSRALTPSLRLGASLFVQYFSAELSQAVPTPRGDGRLVVEGDDWSPGWSLGLLATPQPELTLGLSYSSAVDHSLSGTATTPHGRQPASVRLTTPEVVRAGVRWSLRPDWTLLAGASWTRWSRLERLDIALADGSILSEHHGWRDTWRLDLGAEHARGPWTWRLGTAWDQSPIPDAARRTPRLPDSDRTWLAAGVDYRTEGWTLSLGYAHLWLAGGRGETPPIDYRAHSDILAVGVTWTW